MQEDRLWAISALRLLTTGSLSASVSADKLVDRGEELERMEAVADRSDKPFPLDIYEWYERQWWYMKIKLADRNDPKNKVKTASGG